MKSYALAASLFAATSVFVSGATVTTPNLFNDGISQAPVDVNSSYSTGLFPTGNIDNLGSSQFYFGDYMRENGGANTDLNDQLMSVSALSTPTGIGSLTFFDGGTYETGRVATQVTIYYTKLTLTGSALLDVSNYHTTNGGLAYTLPVSSNPGNNDYTGGTDPVSHFNYDTLSSLSIPAGTKSVLFDFGAEHDYSGGPTFTGTVGPGSDYNVGAGFAEIQAFGGAVVAVPEPSAWAMMIGGLAFLGFCVRRKRASASI